MGCVGAGVKGRVAEGVVGREAAGVRAMACECVRGRDRVAAQGALPSWGVGVCCLVTTSPTGAMESEGGRKRWNGAWRVDGHGVAKERLQAKRAKRQVARVSRPQRSGSGMGPPSNPAPFSVCPLFLSSFVAVSFASSPVLFVLVSSAPVTVLSGFSSVALGWFWFSFCFLWLVRAPCNAGCLKKKTYGTRWVGRTDGETTGPRQGRQEERGHASHSGG
jgi:hypothetical protein